MMLFAHCTCYQIMTPSEFRLVPYMPRFHLLILFVTKYEIYRKNEALIVLPN